MNRTEDKGKSIFCGVSPVGQGLPERAGFKMKKGYHANNKSSYILSKIKSADIPKLSRKRFKG